MLPLVSIIIPVYNSERFLKKALEKILLQTYPNIEIILVDDASTDNSYAIAKTFESNRVKLLQQPNSGAAMARNTGLVAAKGSYIQFLDVDDFLSPDKIEKQVEALKGSQTKLAVCQYMSFNQDEEIQHIQPTDQSAFMYSTADTSGFLINLWGGNGPANFIQTNCWLVPASLIKKSGPWRNYRCPDDDGEFFARVILASEGVEYVPGVYNYYRRLKGENKLSQNSSKKYVQNVLLTIDLKQGYLIEKSKDARVKKAMAKQYVDFAVHNYPKHKILSEIAWKRYKDLHVSVELPLLGGKMVECVKHLLGWKIARKIKYFLS